MTGEDEDRFAHFVMRGKRFNAPGMPGEAAAEISAYTKAIFSIARQLWLDANGRTRLSSRVLDDFDLRLTAVEKGSTKPVLKLHHRKSVDQELVEEWTPYIYAARDQLTSVVRTLGTTGRPPQNFPVECLPDVARLGRSLLDDEKVVIGSPDSKRRGATYTHRLRNIIKSIDEVLEENEHRITLRGSIVEFDSTRSSFLLQGDSGSNVTCRIDAYEERLVKRARDYCSLDGVVAPDVEVVGLTTTPDGEQVVSVYGVSEITEVRSVWEKVVMSRIAILRDLQPGWNGPGSVVPPTGSLDLLDGLKDDISRLHHGVRIGATSSGAIAFEWTSETREYTAKLLPSLTLLLYVDHLDDDDIEEYERPYTPRVLLDFLREGAVQ